MQEKEKQLIIESLLFATPEPLTQKQVNLVFESDSPKILIAGGYNKKVSLSQFARECTKNTKYVILVGETANNIQELIQSVKDEKAEPEVYVATSLDESVRKAYEIAESGDVVLLSPACASYGMFTNYEKRGKRFKELVHHLEE